MFKIFFCKPHFLRGFRDAYTLTKYLLSCRACVTANNRLYVIGGQEGDFMAKPGSPIYKCSRRNEVI